MDWSASKVKLWSLLCSVVLLSSCQSSSSLTLIETEAGIEEYKLIEELDFLKNKQENKDNFLLYIFSSGCMSCQVFDVVIKNYIKVNEVVIYGIDITNEKTLLKSQNDYVYFETTPTLVLFEEGIVKNRFDENINPEFFTNSENLSNSLKKYILLSNKINIPNESILKKMISDKKEFLVYYYYDNCGDCAYFQKYYLLDKLKDHNIKIYFFSMFDYFSDLSLFYNFADEFGLSKKGNELLGYKNGVVPTFQYYKEGTLYKNVIIYNDEFSYQYNDLGEVVSLKVISSYYDDNPFINKTFSSDNISALNKYHEETLNFYIEKFENVLKSLY